jgi:5-methylcytosine-specific restriction enzyme A
MAKPDPDKILWASKLNEQQAKKQRFLDYGRIKMPSHPRDETDPARWQRWYHLPVWQNRSRMQRRLFPLCKYCEEQGITTAADAADHVTPFRGSWIAFIFGELQSLCAACHRAKQNSELHGHKPTPLFSKDIGVSGWPEDPRHPANRVKGQPS